MAGYTMNGISKVTFSFIAFSYLLAASVCVSASPTCVLGGFESQARVVLRHVQLSPAHLKDMTRVVDHLQRILQPLWPGSKVLQFGASASGLALKRSDVDCFLFIPHRNKINADDKAIISGLKSVIMHRPDLFTSIHLKPNADEPVLTFVYAPTKTEVDLAVTRPLSIRDAVILSHILNLDERIMRMAIIVKYWSYVHGISGSEYVLPNYTMTLLVIFYLQQKNILPPIAVLQKKAKPVMVGHWNAGFDLSDHQAVVNESLYELLGGFFKYYSDFNFDDVISPYCGCALKREQIVNLDLPNMLSSYEKNLKLGFAEPFVFGPVNVQDIFELDLNTGRPWNNKSMVDNLLFHTKYAAKVYDSVNSDRFLLTILKAKDTERDLLYKLWTQEEGIYESCLG